VEYIKSGIARDNVKQFGARYYSFETAFQTSAHLTRSSATAQKPRDVLC